MKLKKFLLLITVINLMVFITGAVLARPGQSSLRKSSTAGLFGESYDMLVSSPYFLGYGKKSSTSVAEAVEAGEAEKKVKGLPLIYQGSATVGPTNVFTNLNDLNDDGSFLVGSTFKMFKMGFGVMAEFRMQKTPEVLGNLGLGANANLGLTSATTTGSTSITGGTFDTKQGQGKETMYDYYDPGMDGDAIEEAKLDAEGDLNTKYTNLNFKLAGAFPLSPTFHLGLGFERFCHGTDDFGNTFASYETIGNGKYMFTNKNLQSNQTNYLFDEKYEGTENVHTSHNIINLFVALGKLGPIDTLAIDFGLDLNSTGVEGEITDKITEKTTSTKTTGKETITTE